MSFSCQGSGGQKRPSLTRYWVAAELAYTTVRSSTIADSSAVTTRLELSLAEDHHPDYKLCTVLAAHRPDNYALEIVRDASNGAKQQTAAEPQRASVTAAIDMDAAPRQHWLSVAPSRS